MGSMSRQLLRVAAAALMLAFCAGAATLTGALILDNPASAQAQGKPPGESLGSTSDSDLWRTLRGGFQGTVSSPDKQKGVAIQSEGDNWRALRNGPVSIYGGWFLAAVLIVLGLFFLVRGRIKIEAGWSGREVERFNALERFAHWLTATSFVILGLTGLNLLYGRYVIKPLIGADAFATLTLMGKYTHNFLGFAFMVGLVLILVLWVRGNIPSKDDWVWLKKGGGLFTKGTHPPARKFNAGQKILFWLVIGVGASLSFSGLVLLFPFTLEPFGATFALLNLVGFDLPSNLPAMQEMQLTQLWHAILSLVMIGVIIAHIYIGWLGMEGAYDAMGKGYVDENWAREHHSLWAAELGLEPVPHSGDGPKHGDD